MFNCKQIHLKTNLDKMDNSLGEYNVPCQLPTSPKDPPTNKKKQKRRIFKETGNSPSGEQTFN